MKNKDGIKVVPSLIEAAVLMAVLMFSYEILERLLYPSAALWQRQVLAAGFAVFSVCLIVFFIVQKNRCYAKGLRQELIWLRKAEEHLKEKINELAHFKDMVMWWEKRINGIQKELDSLKSLLDGHNKEG